MMEFYQKKVITRFAPSPTGFMHVGNVRTAIYAWLWAKKNNGTFILRIEDTDKKREVEGSIDHIKRTLLWLGIEWDEGPDTGGPHSPYIQSERLTELDIYKKYADRLIAKGFAYADIKTEEELDALRSRAEAEKRPFLYRDYRPEQPPLWKPGLPLRFKIGTLKRTTWQDAVRGELTAGPEALDDFILIKSDGYPTYNFAHIVDDIEMGVTHVVRGQEFISSTPNYIAVYEALEAPLPIYVTVPPIMGETGNKKMGKRDGAKDTLEYEREGYLPEALFNFLAFLGWNPGDDREVMTRDELIEAFDISHIQRSGAEFHEEKLSWMNKEHMKLTPVEIRNKAILDRLMEEESLKNSPKLLDKGFVKIISNIIFDRISKWSDVNTLVKEGELSYFFEKPMYEKSLLLWKDSTAEDAKKHLEWVANTLSEAGDENFANPDSIKNLIFDYATLNGRGQVLWPTRVALSGKDKSPDPFTLIYALGKKESVDRIRSAALELE